MALRALLACGCGPSVCGVVSCWYYLVTAVLTTKRHGDFLVLATCNSSRATQPRRSLDATAHAACSRVRWRPIPSAFSAVGVLLARVGTARVHIACFHPPASSLTEASAGSLVREPRTNRLGYGHPIHRTLAPITTSTRLTMCCAIRDERSVARRHSCQLFDHLPAVRHPE